MHTLLKSQLLLKPTKVEWGLEVGVEFDKKSDNSLVFFQSGSPLCKFAVELAK